MMELSFAQDKLLILLLGLPFVLGVLYFSRVVESKKISRLSPGISKYLGFRWSSLRFSLRNFCFILGFGAILLSLAGPRWGFEFKEVPHGGRDIMVLFDVSRSMNANDVSPSRMERAKRKILDVISGLKGERIGIIAFAGKAFVHCPLTDDKSMLTLFVNSLDDELISYQGTNLADAVKIAGESLEKGASAQSTGKSLLVITDGEDFSGEIESVKALVSGKTLDLNILGVGTPEGSAIPQKEGSLVKDRKGNVVISKLAESELMDLANGVSGLYVRSTAGDQDVKAILEKVTAPTEAEEMSREKVWNEYFQHALALGLLFLVLGWLITPYQAVATLFLFAVYFLPTSSALGDGFGLFKQKKFEEAALYFEKQASTKDNHHLELYNAAVAHYEAIDYAAAASGFKAASESKNESLKKDALFNLGNTYVAQNKLEEALTPYQEALKLDSGFVKAKENLEWVMKQLQEQKEKNQEAGQKNNSSENQKPFPSESQNSEPKDNSNSESQPPSTNDKPQAEDPSKGAGENQQGSESPADKAKNGKVSDKDSDKDSDKTGSGDKKEDPPPSEGAGRAKEAGEDGSKEDKKLGVKETGQGEIKPGTPLQGSDEAKALLRQVDENMKVWGVKPKFEDSKKDKDW